MPESDSHSALKQLLATKLKMWYGTSITEYPSSGHELDVIAVTESGVTVYIEIIWSPSRVHFLSDINMLQQSDADVKLAVVNPKIITNKQRVREFDKIVISKRRQRQIIHPDLLDGQRILDDTEYVDGDLRRLIDQLISSVRPQTTRKRQLRKPADDILLLNATIFKVTETYAQMASKGIISPSILGDLHGQIRSTLRSKESFRDEIESSKVGQEIKTLVGMEDKPNTLVCSVWPAGLGYSGFAGFAIVNKAPVGATFAGSTSDLIFAINIPGTVFSPTYSRIVPEDSSKNYSDPTKSWDTIAIYIPPGFKVSGAEQIMATLSNARISVLKASSHDRYGPGWTVACVSVDTTTYGGAGLGRTSYKGYTPFIDSTSDKKCHYVRIKEVNKPSIAGRYFFKIALLNSKSSPRIRGEGISNSGNGEQFIQIENWPVLLVKGEINPAIISGTIRYGDRYRTLYGQPIHRPGRVIATMIARLDPYTGKVRHDLPLVDASGYFDAAAHGRYVVDGLAPGVYNLYASAAGFPQTLIQHAVKVRENQLLHLDGNLQPGVVVHGRVFSKTQTDDVPWVETVGVKIELYDAPTLDHLPAPTANRIFWAGVFDKNQVPKDSGTSQNWFVRGGTTIPFHFKFGVKGKYGAQRDFDGMVPQICATWVNGLTPGRYYARAWVPRYNQSTEDGSTFQEYCFDITPNKYAEVRKGIYLRSIHS